MTHEETTIRELEIKLAAMERRFEDLRASDKQALELQADEYERRLVNLNNENARIQAAQNTYVSYSVLFGIVMLLIAIAALLWTRHF